MPTISVAVVIPTLDEQEMIRRHLPAVVSAADEVVVSDGGSRDGTARLAGRLGARVVVGPCGRGPQMNLGARHTHSDVLVFLHADSRLPPGAVDAVRSEADAGRVGGGFLVRFDDPRLLYRLGSALVNLRTRLTRGPLGDQAQFATRRAFDDLGGFRDWPILEDLDFIRRLKDYGSVAIISSKVRTSARRYIEEGIWRTIANNWTIWTLYFLGVSPHRLADRYRRVR